MFWLNWHGNEPRPLCMWYHGKITPLTKTYIRASASYMIAITNCHYIYRCRCENVLFSVSLIMSIWNRKSHSLVLCDDNVVVAISITFWIHSLSMVIAQPLKFILVIQINNQINEIPFDWPITKIRNLNAGFSMQTSTNRYEWI